MTELPRLARRPRAVVAAGGVDAPHPMAASLLGKAPGDLAPELALNHGTVDRWPPEERIADRPDTDDAQRTARPHPAPLIEVLRRPPQSAEYLAIRYAERLAEAGVVASVGSRGDSCHNAMAEAFSSVLPAELVRHRGPWSNLDDLEIAVAEYIDRFNHRRLHGEIGPLPPVEYEPLHQSTRPEHQPTGSSTPPYNLVRRHTTTTRCYSSLLAMLLAKRTHRAHVIIEQVITDLKISPLAHRPFEKFTANSARPVPTTSLT